MGTEEPEWMPNIMLTIPTHLTPLAACSGDTHPSLPKPPGLSVETEEV